MTTKKQAPVAGPKKAAKTKADGVGELARKLLVETDKTYPEILEAIRAKNPQAKTSARSIASIASVLRKKGVEVPMRRSPKKEG